MSSPKLRAAQPAHVETVYITKWWETCGIIEGEIEIPLNHDGTKRSDKELASCSCRTIARPGQSLPWSVWSINKEWFRKREDAVAFCELKRMKALRGVFRKLDELMGLDF